MLLPGVFVVLVTWLGARFALRRRDHRGPAGGVLRVRGVPGPPAAHAHRGDRQDHPRARRGPPGRAACFAWSPELTDPAHPAPAARRRRRPGRRRVRPGGAGPGSSPRVAAAAPEDAQRDRRPARPVRRRRRRGWPAYRCATWPLAAVRRPDPGGRQRRAPVHRAAARRSWTSGGAADDRAGRGRRSAAASATDVVDALPDGLDTEVAERGREFSGGQQQRLRLARALLADPPVLVLVEPTSAVDAHTEARIAARLRRRPRRPHHRGLHHQPAGARPRRPRGLRRGTAGSSPRAPTASCWTPSPAYAATVTRGED